MSRTKRRLPDARRLIVPVLASVGLLLLTGVPQSQADDRDLLRESSGAPYVFILLDNSGSMNWTPKCTAAQLAKGDCKQLCELGDCYARLQGDDPNSKAYQAKEALYEVLKGINDVQFGFGTYNQDDLSVLNKHWIYKVRDNGVTLPGGTSGGVVYSNVFFPAAGTDDVIGPLWTCDTGNNDHEIGCYQQSPADVVETDGWDLARMQRFPKGGLQFNQDVTIYIRHAGVKYKVRYHPTGGGLPGDAVLKMAVRVDKCTKTDCSTLSLVAEPTINFDRATNSNGQPAEFLSWDVADTAPIRVPTKDDPSITYFTQGEASDSSATNLCTGWDDNGDATSDPGPDHTKTPRYNMRWTTDSSDSRGSLFSFGDVIPLDWKVDHNADIRGRLAPNTVLNSLATPDFRDSPYLKNQPGSGDSFLRLVDDRARPIIPFGSTPLGNSMKSFRTWYSGCATGNCPKGSGWKSIAGAQDPNWGCRKKFLLILTDGDDTCGGTDPCTTATALNSQEGILTYVVAFGVDNTTGNKLNCMAANGGTKAPIYPQNKQELIKALTDIFGQIREQAAAFASAAVPTVQAESADKIYVSNFTPLNSEPVWDGHVHGFLKPLPRLPDGRPNISKVCAPVGDPDRGNCHLWDAGLEIQKQAPEMADIGPVASVGAAQLRLGTAPTERRVFYPTDGTSVPRTLRLFAPPSGTPPATDPPPAGNLWVDLFDGLKIPSSPAAVRAASATRSRTIMAEALTIKHSSVTDASGASKPVDFLLGDTFHADPAIADRPADFTRYSHNLYTLGKTCTEAVGTDPGYRCFADKLRRRRKMLVVGSDDGQLHFFDAGTWQPGTAGKAGRFNDGTGAEIFSYIPRIALPIIRDLAEKSQHIFGIDSTPRIDDVFIDPVHNGTPTPAERQWRTVVIGGFREGGDPMGGTRMTDFVSGYYALDITQPDPVEKTAEEGIGADGLPHTVQWEPENNDPMLPACLRTDNTAVSGCGPAPFPSLLWEFTDSIGKSQLDEDKNGQPDLGQTWSAPTIGLIRVKEGGTVVEKNVAIFGGGMDADSKGAPRRGGWLYMVDVETGKLIYKRALSGATPAEPAVVDSNSDGILDKIYIGTTAGNLYKVDLSVPVDLKSFTVIKDRALPALAADTVVQRVTDPLWDPFPIFNTSGRPIYYAPTALYLAKLGTVALAFGSGDREDLWDLSGQEGRFYLIVDENFTTSQVRDESLYQQIRPSDLMNGTDFVMNPNPGKSRGWFLRLDANERVITPAFGLVGFLTFSSYEPQITVSGGASGPTCGRTGLSRVYLLFANNANGVLKVAGLATRYQEVPVFLAPPTIDSGPTQNGTGGTAGGNGTGGTGVGAGGTGSLTTDQQAILAELKKYFSTGTRFGNYWYDVSAMGSDTRYVGIAAIPIGIVQQNWKEN
jgi:hypothetical protein